MPLASSTEMWLTAPSPSAGQLRLVGMLPSVFQQSCHLGGICCCRRHCLSDLSISKASTGNSLINIRQVEDYCFPDTTSGESSDQMTILKASFLPGLP
jgi:hypothetical protein